MTDDINTEDFLDADELLKSTVSYNWIRALVKTVNRGFDSFRFDLIDRIIKMENEVKLCREMHQASQVGLQNTFTEFMNYKISQHKIYEISNAEDEIDERIRYLQDTVALLQKIKNVPCL